MAPFVAAFPASQLEEMVQYTATGKRRKQPLDLKQCKLFELLQYDCNVVDKRNPKSVVMCEPVARLFRKCADGLTVETTAWEY